MARTTNLLAAICSTLLFAHIALAVSSTFIQCQLKKTAPTSQLQGCPAGTIFVSATDPSAKFQKVQDAILSLPTSGNAVILIGEGEYHETVNVTRKAPITLLGQLSPQNALDPAGNATSKNLVKIWDNKYAQTGVDNAHSATIIISPASNTINSDFRAYNIDFENRAANYAISQALAIDVSYANASFYGCAFASYQDTWYTGRNANTYVVDSIIYGQVDYIFGYGTAWFQNVTLANRACGGGIVAWKGTDLTEAPGNKFGAYIADSTIIRSPDANATAVTDGKCFLGRPWNDLATTVFLRTFMDKSIQPAGWTPWNADRPVIINTTYYAEYASSGPGGVATSRIPISHILTSEQATEFTIEKIFSGPPQWIDYGYVH